MEERSDVETTSTAFLRPSGPMSRSMNSRTSRPRSPMSASTQTSAVQPFEDTGQQGGLAAACRGEDAHALPFPAGQHTVDDAQAQGDGLADDLAGHGIGRFGHQRIVGARPDGRTAVHGLPQTVHHTAQQLMAHGDGKDPPVGMTSVAGEMPCMLPRGDSRATFLTKPTTSALRLQSSQGLRSRQSSPPSHRGPRHG